MTESSSRDADDCNAACSNGSRWRQHPLMSFVAGLTLVAAALLFLNSSVQLEGGSMLFAAPTSNNLPRRASAAPGEGPRSKFSSLVQWDTTVDSYGDQYLAMCLALKNQHGDIREWVAHHKAVGAGKIYIYDTGSEPPLNELLMDHLKSGFVEYIWHPYNFDNQTAKRPVQVEIYQICMKRVGNRHQFLGFLDSDEVGRAQFLILESGTPSVPALLQRMMAFEPFGGLVVHWRIFGSSGHVNRPEGGVLRNYNKCLGLKNVQNSHIKTIVNTDLADHPGKDPHHWIYKSGFYAVTEHFQRVNGPSNDHVTTDKIVIHHYVLKSFEDYKQKMERGSAMGNHKPLKFFKAIDREVRGLAPSA